MAGPAGRRPRRTLLKGAAIATVGGAAVYVTPELRSLDVAAAYAASVAPQTIVAQHAGPEHGQPEQGPLPRQLPHTGVGGMGTASAAPRPNRHPCDELPSSRPR